MIMGQKQVASRGRILWVDDDYYHLCNLLRPLVKAGFEVVPARSYEEARAILDSDWRQFRLIVLDLILPLSESRAVETPQEATDRGNAMADDEALAENGIALFDYLTTSLGVTVPILLLSVVKTKPLLDRLMNKGAAARLEKHGLLPAEVKRTVLEVLGESEGGGYSGSEGSYR